MFRTITLIAVLCLVPTLAPAEEKRTHEFGYDRENGPEVWATLSEHYSKCGEGRHQSPIDLTDPRVMGEVEVELDYEPTALNLSHHEHREDILDNGHTIQVSYDEKSKLEIEDKTYELKQFHFHTPSEHTVDGMHFPMEMHMVHASESGDLAVFGIFFVRGEHNANFDPIVNNLPEAPGDEVHVEGATVDLEDMLPESKECYSYTGSLTTPPCSEGVSWFLAMNPVEMSAEQIEAFTCRLRQNNRPPQPLNDRVISRTEIE